MGKGAKGRGKFGKKSGYIHNHNPNPRAFESDERRTAMLKGIEVKRLANHVLRQKEVMREFFTEDQKAIKAQKIDPAFDLKGGARAARDYYKDPNMKEAGDARDLLAEYQGRVSEHEEGLVLLQYMHSLGTMYHNLVDKTTNAIYVFEEAMVLDKADTLHCRYPLLRCHLDLGDAAKARALISAFPDDKSACFAYSLAFIEFISLMLEEEDASEAARDAALKKAYEVNPYTLWTIVYNLTFKECVEHQHEIFEKGKPLPPGGSVEDAIMFFELDSEIWQQTDGAVEWAASIGAQVAKSPPLISQPDGIGRGDDRSDKSKKRKWGSGETRPPPGPEETHRMYVGMYNTAIEMATG